MSHSNTNITAPVIQALPIPLDHNRRHRTYEQDNLNVQLDRTVYEAVQAKIPVAHQEAFFTAVFFAWMYRLSAETELASLIYSNTAGWNVWELELHPALTISELMNQCHDLRTSSATRLTEIGAEVVFSYLSAGDKEQSATESVEALQQLPEAMPEPIMALSVAAEEDAYRIHVRYDRSLLLADTMKRYTSYYNVIALEAVSRPEMSISSYDILSEYDRAAHEQLNATEVPYPEQQTIHGMFESAAAQYPEHGAIASGTRELTYRELNSRANEIAAELLSRGLEKGDFVTIYMERSIETVISLLGIMKAGGVYVPVDPDHPAERNGFIVEDTHSAYVLTKQSYQGQAAELCSSISTVREILIIEELLAGREIANPQLDVSPDDLAYIIYTSGSTGRPKGALISHRGVVNLGAVVKRDCDIEPHDVLTQFATYSFDASIWDTIGALFYGAKLYLLSSEERVSVEEFAEAVERTGTTIITILPTVFFNQLSTYLSDEGYRKLSRVKIITVAGEALYGNQVRAFQKKFGTRTDIVNVYGPTECTVATTTHRIRGAVDEEQVHIPIGRPIHNYQVYVLNEENRLCPVNVPGELCISTPALAKGYLNQPERTAQSFVDNPFIPGGRMYRSGDIVRLLPNGTLEYAGRKDSQLKIRGNRIEIGEIEEQLARHADIQDVAVIAKKDAQGQNMLVGYYTTTHGTELETADIKAHLAAKLPSYFIPDFIIGLERMPLSPTGKLDRKKLASMPHEQYVQTNALPGEPPQTETEQRIADAWQEVLGHGGIMRDDDFFRIGGNSLHIIHVLAKLKPHYPGLRIGDFFRHTTAHQLADYVQQLAQQSEQPLSASGAEQQVNLTQQGPKIELNEHPLEFVPDKSFAPRPIHKLLITGASGYLGSHILHDVLRFTEAEVFVMMRHTETEAAYQRLAGILTEYFGASAAHVLRDRVTIVYGNLEEPNLGMLPEVHKLLSEQLDAIIHSAADVRHFGDSAAFERTNVNGTRALLDLVASRPGMSFHHISTMGIPEDLAMSGQWERALQHSSFPADMQLENLYSNSKLDAERLLFEAAASGIPVTAYRAGNLSCHSASGRFQTNIESNAYYRMLKAMLLLNKAPEADWDTDFTPIDYASRAVVELAFNAESANRIYHICNPQPLPYADLIDMMRELGYTIDTLPFAEYTSWLLNPSSQVQDDALQLAMGQLEGDGAKSSAYRYGCAVTAARLEQLGVRCPVTDQAFIQQMVKHAIDVGYFPQPAVLQQQSATR